MNNLSIIDHIRNNAIPLRTATDLQPLVDAIGDARFVLLGEASHGTSEFYAWRIEPRVSCSTCMVKLLL